MSCVPASLLTSKIHHVIYLVFTHMPTFSPFRALPLRVITQDMHSLPLHPPKTPNPLHPTHPPPRLAVGLDIYNSSFIWHSQSCLLLHTAVAHFTG